MNNLILHLKELEEQSPKLAEEIIKSRKDEIETQKNPKPKNNRKDQRNQEPVL